MKCNICGSYVLNNDNSPINGCGNCHGESKYQIYQRALKKWGQASQENTAIEEMAELIKALMKGRRNNVDHYECLNDIIEELADVSIMVEQLEQIYGCDQYQEMKVQKISRLQKMLEAGENQCQ